MNYDVVTALADRELSTGSRAGHVALLLGGFGMSAVTGSLWLTETGLPLPASIAFAVMAAMGAGWSLYAWWVLRARRPLFGFQQVVAARVALAFCLVGTVGGLWGACTRQSAAAWCAAALFGSMTLMAAILLARARSRHCRLLVRRLELERQLEQQP